MQTLLIYALITPALYYLGSQALITRWLWGRYPQRVDAFMSCAACSGTWYGVMMAWVGWWQKWSFLGLDPRHWLTVVVVGLCSCFWTPVLSRRMLDSMRYDPIPSVVDRDAS
jgi:hypothetical protein